MELLQQYLSLISGYVWGTWLIVLLTGTGIILTFRLKFIQVRRLATGFRNVFSGSGKKTPDDEDLLGEEDEEHKGDVTPFQSLMTALAATIGTGNIVGATTAIVAGGPGAMFWMWMAAFFGMATKYGEAILAVRFRKTNANGLFSGGPMYYIRYGMDNKWLAVFFAACGSITAFGTGCMVQSNAISSALESTFSVDPATTGVVLTILTATVVLGGIKNISKVASLLVPGMAGLYIIGAFTILVMNYNLIPDAFATIFNDAFTGNAVAGGAVGTVIRYGIARGIFSNEAGLGTAPIVAAAAKTDMPGRQALVSMLGTFIDTLIVCTMTGLVVVMSGLWKTGLNGAALTSHAFEGFLPGIGAYVVTIGLVLFAFSTIVGWCYYGEKCFEYLFGTRPVKLYRSLFTAFVFIGAVASLDIVWTLADITNGLMAAPNLIALIVLSGVIVKESKNFDEKLDEEEAARDAFKEINK